MSTSKPSIRRRGRPPKLDRERVDSKYALIRCGVELLTEKGFVATGLDELLQRAQVPKGSFYHYFESKEAYGREIVAAYDEYFRKKIVRYLEDEGVRPLDRIRSFVEDAAKGMRRYAFSRGCLIGNLGQEVSALPEGFRQQLDEILLGWQQITRRCLEDAKSSGGLSENANCDELASFFWIGWEGAILRARLSRSEAPLHTFLNVFLSLLP